MFAQRRFKMLLIDDMESYGMEMWRYRHNYRRSPTEEYLEEQGVLPEPNTFYTSDATAFYDNLEVEDMKVIEDIEPPEEFYGSTITKDSSTILILSRFMNEDGLYGAFYSGGYYFHTNVNGNDVTEGDKKYELVNGSLEFTLKEDLVQGFGVPTDVHANFDVYTVRYDEENEEYYTEYSYSTTFTKDTTQYAFSKLLYRTKDNEFAFPPIIDEVYISPYFTIDNYLLTTDPVTLNFSPVIPIRGEFQAPAEEAKEKKLLRKLGVDFSLLTSMVNNDQIDDLRLTYALAPHEALKSSAICKYMYHFFEEVGGEEDGVFTRGNLTEGNREIEVIMNNDALTAPEPELTMTYKFILFSKEVTGLIPNNNSQDYKVKIKQNITNRQKYRLMLEEVYSDYIGGGGSGMSSEDMYMTILNAYLANPTNTTLIKAHNELPPKDCMNDKKPSRVVYAFADPNAMVDSMKETLSFKLDPNSDDVTVIYDIVWYRPYNTGVTDATLYHATSETKLISLSTSVKMNHHKVAFIIKIYKQITPTKYREYTFTRGSISYEINGERTAEAEYKDGDSNFKFVTIYDYVKHLKFKEWVAIHDSSVCAIIYVHQRIKVKWYQTAGWQLVFQIIMVVISIAVTVATAGAGATVATVLTDMVINFIVAYAVAKLIDFISGTVGGTLGSILAVASFVAISIATNGASITDPALWLQSADIYMKAELRTMKIEAEEARKTYENFMAEMDKKSALVADSMQNYIASDENREIALEKLVRGNYSSNLKMTLDDIDKIFDESWKNPPMRTMMLDPEEELVRTNVRIPRPTIRFREALSSSFKEGDVTHG